jgi:hypothetical protein
VKERKMKTLLLPLLFLFLINSVSAQPALIWEEPDESFIDRVEKMKAYMKSMYEEPVVKAKKDLPLYRRGLINTRQTQNIQQRGRTIYFKSAEIKKHTIANLDSILNRNSDILKNWTTHFEAPCIPLHIGKGMAGILSGPVTIAQIDNEGNMIVSYQPMFDKPKVTLVIAKAKTEGLNVGDETLIPGFFIAVEQVSYNNRFGEKIFAWFLTPIDGIHVKDRWEKLRKPR